MIQLHLFCKYAASFSNSVPDVNVWNWFPSLTCLMDKGTNAAFSPLFCKKSVVGLLMVAGWKANAARCSPHGAGSD